MAPLLQSRAYPNVGTMPATRVLPTEEATALLELTRDIATRELLPSVAEAEATETFPREMFRTLGRAGLLGLPYPEEYGGGGQPYEVYLQVVEEIATVWASVGVGRLGARAVLLRAGRPGAPRSSGRSGCPTCSAASCSAPTASPRRTPAPTPRR